MTVADIQGIAREIMDALGVGYPDTIYKAALYRELMGPDVAVQRELPVVYKGHFLGTCRADLVTPRFVVEVHAVPSLLPVHDTIGQSIRKCLRLLRRLEPECARVGLVINFNQTTGTPEFLLYQPLDDPEQA